jgi:protein-disulfide isomerase
VRGEFLPVIKSDKHTLKPKTESQIWPRYGRALLVVLAVITALGIFGACSNNDQANTEGEVGKLETGITEDGFPYKGSPDAPVKMIEYSDYLCGHCKAFALEKEPRITEEYVEAGKVQYIFHYYALGEAQVLLGEAAHCAADQGRFWDYHRVMFESQDQFASIATMEDLQALLVQFAEQAGLEVSDFEACWDSHQHQQTIIDAVMSAREQGVGGTPTFSIQGELLVGNQPYEVFQEAIEAALKDS